MTQFANNLDREHVIAIHGSASSGAQWSALTNDLVGRFFVNAPDLPGYGKIGPTHASARQNQLSEVASIKSLVRSVGAPCHVVAHSFGGAIALRFALDNPDLVKSLAIFEPATFHLLRDGDEDCLNALNEIQALNDALSDSISSGYPDLECSSLLTIGMERAPGRI